MTIYKGFSLKIGVLNECNIFLGSKLVEVVSSKGCEESTILAACQQIDNYLKCKKKKDLYSEAYSDQCGARMHLSEEEKDLIQKHAN